MQQITYIIGTTKKPPELWRAIPAEITVKGLTDTSGNWIFLVDSDYFDGAILSGAVTVSGADLIVTLSEMNTVELANAIKGKSQLICRGTLTDGVTQVQLIPISVKNRAVSGTPTPVAEYYTKAQIDALSSTGEEIVALTGTEITPAHAKVFQHTLAASEVFTIDTTALTATRQVTFEVHLIQPSTAVPFTLPSGILWEDDGAFAAANQSPDFSTGNTLYALVFRWDGNAILGNLAYTKVV